VIVLQVRNSDRSHRANWGFYLTSGITGFVVYSVQAVSYEMLTEHTFPKSEVVSIGVMTSFTYLVNLFLILIRNSALDVEDYKISTGRLAFGYIFF